MVLQFIINIAYLFGAFAFIWGLRLLSSPDSARKGNFFAGIGMAVAIVAAMVEPFSGAANNYPCFQPRADDGYAANGIYI